MDELKAGQGLMTDKHAAELAASQDAARKAQSRPRRCAKPRGDPEGEGAPTTRLGRLARAVIPSE
jgi:hypothetical protein